MLQIEGDENWMTPIVSYLKDGRLLEEKDEARKFRVKSARYILMDEVLYKRGFSQPLLRCLAPDEANYMLGRFIKEHVKTIREPDHSSIKSSVADSIG